MTNEELFNKIVSSEEIDIKEYKINIDIIKNKNDMVNYWKNLENEKEKFTVFELNLIWYFLRKRHRKYVGYNKTQIIKDINYAVRIILQEPAYEGIKCVPNYACFR